MPENDLRGTEFDGADLTGARFRKTHLNDARFRMVDMSGAVMRDVSLSGATIDGHHRFAERDLDLIEAGSPLLAATTSAAAE
jgi:uncharacterized protein YjbI with pentapeptide repeats